MVSFQFAKNEYGEKTFKPLVNLHVTPNENIINKVGALFKQKQFGGFGGIGGAPSYNQHYHTHTHYPGPSYHHPHHYETIPPHFDGPPHHFESGPHFEHPPHHFSTGTGEFYPSGYANDYGFSSPAYHDSYHSTNNIDSSLATTGPSLYESFEPNAYNSRNANISAIGQATYADNYVNYNQNFAEQQQQQQQYQSQNIAQAKIGQNNQNQGTATKNVSFPKNRRKRNANSDNDTNKESIAPKINRLEKVKYNTGRINQSDRSLKNKQTKASSRNDIPLTQRLTDISHTKPYIQTIKHVIYTNIQKMIKTYINTHACKKQTAYETCAPYGHSNRSTYTNTNTSQVMLFDKHFYSFFLFYLMHSFLFTTFICFFLFLLSIYTRFPYIFHCLIQLQQNRKEQF